MEGIKHRKRLKDPPRACVVIPALNEEKTIYRVVRKTLSVDPSLKVIVIDDGSTDKTAKRAREAGAHVIRLKRNMGQWEALRLGFRKALKEGFNVVITMDGDGQHDPLFIPFLLEPIEKGRADLVVGSRFLCENSHHIVTAPYRHVGVKFLSWLFSLLTGVKLTDVMSGFRAYSSDLLRLLVRKLRERQYGALEAIFIAWRSGARICELPVNSKANKESKKGSMRFFLNLCRVLLRTLFIIMLCPSSKQLS